MSDLFGKLNSLRSVAVCEKQPYIADELFNLINEYGWRPVSKNPEFNGFYVVSCFSGGDQGEHKVGIDYFFGGVFTRRDVIAWMPLPDPYQPKGE